MSRPWKDQSVKRQIYPFRVFRGRELLLVVIDELVPFPDDRIQTGRLIRKTHIFVIHGTGLFLSLLVLRHLAVIGETPRDGGGIFRGDAPGTDLISAFGKHPPSGRDIFPFKLPGHPVGGKMLQD